MPEISIPQSDQEDHMGTLHRASVITLLTYVCVSKLFHVTTSTVKRWLRDHKTPHVPWEITTSCGQILNPGSHRYVFQIYNHVILRTSFQVANLFRWAWVHHDSTEKPPDHLWPWSSVFKLRTPFTSCLVVFYSDCYKGNLVFDSRYAEFSPATSQHPHLGRTIICFSKQMITLWIQSWGLQTQSWKKKKRFPHSGKVCQICVLVFTNDLFFLFRE